MKVIKKYCNDFIHRYINYNFWKFNAIVLTISKNLNALKGIY